MQISAVDVALLDLPLVEPFAAAHGTTRSRTVTVVRVTAGETVGWGECSALPSATYTAESAAGCFRLLADEIGPELVGRRWRSGDLARLARRRPGSPMAMAAIEMAVLDAELTAAGTSLARWLGATAESVPAGVSLGLDRPGTVVAKARGLVVDGYRRLKVKIQPGHDLDVLRALRSEPTIASVGVDIHLDGNGAYRAADLETLVALARSGADALEQPLDPDDVDASVRLVDRLAEGPGSPIPVVADEAVTDLADAVELADRGAITGVSIKPARIGGLATARELHDLCRARALAATAGGMLETGLGRHALAALAALPGFDLTGDVSPASRWLAADPWPDLTLVDGRIPVPTGPGVAPPPDRDLLARHTVDRWSSADGEAGDRPNGWSGGITR